MSYNSDCIIRDCRAKIKEQKAEIATKDVEIARHVKVISWQKKSYGTARKDWIRIIESQKAEIASLRDIVSDVLKTARGDESYAAKRVCYDLAEISLEAGR